MPSMLEGLIERHGLTRWWTLALSIGDRERLESLFRPLAIAVTETHRPTQTADETIRQVEGGDSTGARFLSELIGWLRGTREDDAIRRKLRTRLADLTVAESEPLARHFALQVLIREYYRDRECDPLARQLAIEACQSQIQFARAAAEEWIAKFALPLPRHVGYEQLAMIREKDRDYSGVIELCEQARRQGWAGDWEKRIVRCRACMARGNRG